MLGLDVRDSRLKDVVEPLEKGNFKKALGEVNKVLRKTPNCSTAKLLKALVLLKSGKSAEAVPLAEEIIRACPTDESTLNVVLCYFRETGQTHREVDYLQAALKKCPDREDLLVYLFLNHVQSGNFAEQQATARLLSQQFPSPLYIYWVIVSTILQAEADPTLAKRVYLPLAEKMLLREANAGKMKKHSEFQLLLDVLRRLEKNKDALQFLDNTTITDQLDKLDYRCDYSMERLKIFVSLDLWEDALRLGEEKLNENPNDWNTWKCLIELTTGQANRDLNASRVDRLDALLTTLMNKHPNVRGPHLAKLDLSATLLRRGWDFSSSAEISSLLHAYMQKFAIKPICAFDVSYLLPMLLPKESDAKQFLSDLVNQLANKEIQVPADTKQIYRHLCVYQVARANQFPISLVDLIHTYFAFAPERAKLPSNLPKQLGDEQVSAGAVDLCPTDGLMLLILSALSDQPTLPSVSRGSGALASALLSAYWVEYLGVVHASNNHHFRLRLCSLFSPHALACPDLSLAQTDRLDVKQLLYVSLGHNLVSATPMLTLWSTIQSQASQHQQHPDNNSPILSIINHIRGLSSLTVNEAKDGVSAAYRRGAYVKVREFTQFVDRLRHADVFLTARIELLHWQLAVVPDNFDSLLEMMGPATRDLETVTKRMEHIVDCRDFRVSPNFDPPCAIKHTQEDSFAHLVRWLNLRLLTVRMLHKCSELVMSAVDLGDQRCSGKVPDLSTELGERATKACEQLDQLSTTNLRKLFTEAPPLCSHMEELTTEKLIEELVLPPEHLFTAPSILPNTQMASLYLHGPFGQVLDAGVHLILGLYRLLAQGEEHISAEQVSNYVNLLKGDTAPASTNDASPAQFSVLRNLPSVENTGRGYLLKEHAYHPAGVILLLGALLETVALQCIFLSMLRSILLPRSHIHLRSGKQQKRKGSKTQKGKHTGDVERTNHVDESTPLLKRLDALGFQVLTAITDISGRVQHLTALTEGWLQWVKEHACDEYIQLASRFSDHLLPQAILEKYPALTPEPKASLFKEVAKSHEKTFDRLLTGFRMKQTSLARLRDELLVYEVCATKMSECVLDESAP